MDPKDPLIRSTLALLALSWMVSGAPAAAQLPEEFTNLEILPETIGQQDLIAVMRGFSMGLGVRCRHCHVGEEGRPLSTFDFASDEKEAKRVARVMMRMTRQINGTFLPRTGRESLLEVGCVTCHRGVARPRSLEDALLQELAENGIDAALGEYGELRERYRDSGSYDFSETTLLNLAERLVARDEADGALAFVELNLQHFPDSGLSHFYRGEVYLRLGDKPRARTSFERALELDPENPRARERLQALVAE